MPLTVYLDDCSDDNLLIARIKQAGHDVISPRGIGTAGIDDRDHSCAADLAALTRIVLAKSRIARIVRKAHAAVRFPIKGGKLYLNNTNPLLRMGYPGTIGLKTGDTIKAGHCLIAVVHRGGRTLAAIVLHSPNPQLQVRRLFAKAFRA